MWPRGADSPRLRREKTCWGYRMGLCMPCHHPQTAPPPLIPLGLGLPEDTICFQAQTACEGFDLGWGKRVWDGVHYREGTWAVPGGAVGLSSGGERGPGVVSPHTLNAPRPQTGVASQPPEMFPALVASWPHLRSKAAFMSKCCLELAPDRRAQAESSSSISSRSISSCSTLTPAVKPVQ